MPPHEKLVAPASPVPMTTETLESRVRRLTQILASCGRDVDTSGQDESQAALKRFSAALGSIQQVTAEIRSRIGSGDWDAGDALAARLLLDAVTAAVRSCRVVSHETTSRLVEVEATLKKGYNFVLREERTKRET